MTSPIRKTIGARIRLLRTSRTITQAELAEAIDCEDSSIGRFERGESSPDGEQLLKMAKYFGLSPMEFFPTEVETHWQAVRDLRSELINLISLIDEPKQLEHLLDTARRHKKA